MTQTIQPPELADSLCTDFQRDLHIQGVASLFERSFGRPFDPRVWDWKYSPQAPLPAGKVRIVDGQIQAFYGGTQRRWCWRGKALTGLQMGDVMVAPEERGRMRKMGAMAQLCRELCLERIQPVASLEQASASQQPTFSFGFPSDRPFRIGERTALYIRSGELLQVHWGASDQRPSLKHALRPLLQRAAGAETLMPGGHGQSGLPSALTEWPSVSKTIDRLWQSMTATLPDRLLGVREPEWVDWRYLQHPAHRYQLLLMSGRLTGQPEALLVVRTRPEELEWVDFVGDPRHLQACIRALRRYAKTQGRSLLSCWVHQNMQSLFDFDGAQFKSSGIIIPVNGQPEAAFPAQAGQALWLMPGDTDFR